MNEIKKNLSKWMYWFLLAVSVILVYKFLDNFTQIGNAIKSFFDTIAPFSRSIISIFVIYTSIKNREKNRKIKKKIYKEKSKRNKCIYNICNSNIIDNHISKCNIASGNRECNRISK